MNYEKAYKAVLQTATQWIKDGCTDKEKICLECIFPELRESDDEKVRKKCIAIISKWTTKEDRDECIAYLEKQKEQKPEVKDPFSNANFVRGYESGYADAKREQKPAEWSEEDEAMRDNILRVLSCFSGTVECESTPSLSTTYPTYKREIDWLKALRPSWKPSEEQMENLEMCFTLSGAMPDFRVLESLYDDLKKLI